MNTALLARIMSEESEIATILKEFDIEVVRSEEVIGGQRLDIGTQTRFDSTTFENTKIDLIRSIAREIKNQVSQGWQRRNPKNIKIAIEHFEISDLFPGIKRITLRVNISVGTIRSSAHQEYEQVMCNAVHIIDDSSKSSIIHRVINFANTISQFTYGIHKTNVLILSQIYYQLLKYEWNQRNHQNGIANLFTHIPSLKELVVIIEDEDEDRGSGRIQINATCLKTRRELSEKKSDILFFDSWDNAIYNYGGIELIIHPYTVAVLEN